MEIRELRALDAIVKTGSFTAAAARLHVTQPTVSKLLAGMEEKVGKPLLQRQSRQITLTDAGHVVMKRAETILQELRQLDDDLGNLDSLKQGVLRVGVPPLGPRLFGNIIREFKRRYPNVELRLFEDGSIAIEAALIKGELDVGALLAPIDASRFDHRVVFDGPLDVVTPAWSRWSKCPEVRLSELAEEPLILFTAAFIINDRILNACREQGFTPEVVGRSSQTSLILEMVRSGVGIVMLPASETASLDRSLFAVSKLVAPVIPWRIEVAWLRDGYLSAAALKWIEVVGKMRGEG